MPECVGDVFACQPCQQINPGTDQQRHSLYVAGEDGDAFSPHTGEHEDE